jgi:hypothetical protein
MFISQKESSDMSLDFKRSMLGALVALAFACQVSTPAMAQTGPAAHARQMQGQAPLVAAAAQRDFSQFVQSNVQTRSGTLPGGFPLDVTDVQDLKNASLGHAYPVYTVDPQDVLGRGDLRTLARPSGQWRIVILLDTRAIGLATVEQVNGRWEVSEYGAAALAGELEAAAAVHGNAAHSNLRFVRIYQAQSDLLEVVSESDAHVRFAPLQSARHMLQAQKANGKAGGLLEQSELIDPLRASVKSNMEAFR